MLNKPAAKGWIAFTFQPVEDEKMRAISSIRHEKPYSIHEPRDGGVASPVFLEAPHTSLFVPPDTRIPFGELHSHKGYDIGSTDTCRIASDHNFYAAAGVFGVPVRISPEYAVILLCKPLLRAFGFAAGCLAHCSTQVFKKTIVGHEFFPLL
jgi:hypothetical protein